jgi:hypothetical protein
MSHKLFCGSQNEKYEPQISLQIFCEPQTFTNMSRLQKVETRNLQLAGTGERLIISNGYNRHNARSPVPARKNLLFAGDSNISPIGVMNELKNSRI